MKFKVEPTIFEKFPQVRIGVLVVLGMDNKKGQKEIDKLLSLEEERKSKEFADVDLKENPKIAYWRQAYKKFSSNPRKNRPSVEALLRRVVNGNKLPHINPLVDFYNYISLKHLLPAGAEDLDKIRGNIVLGFAKGDEQGNYIGSDEVSTCYKGEVVYKDDEGFICRRWNWREGDRTKIEPDSRNVVVVIEAGPVVSEKEFQEALDETTDLIKKNLKAQVSIHILDKNNLSFEIDFKTGKKLAKKDFEEVKKIKRIVKRESRSKKITDDLVDKQNIAWKIQELVWQAAKKLVKDLKIEEIHLEHPENEKYGDYSSNIAMQLAFKDKKPWDLASLIVKNLPKTDFLKKVEVAGSGFINFYLAEKFLIEEMGKILKEKDDYGSAKILSGKKILLEHTSPDPIKTMHIGHLRNNFLGMSIYRILEFLGVEVTPDCINNDRGTHICQAILGFLAFAKKARVNKKELLDFAIPEEKVKKILKDFSWRKALGGWLKNPRDWFVPEDLKLKSDHFDLRVYAAASKAIKLVPELKEQVQEILVAWEKEEKELLKLWRQIIDWSLEGYEETYERIGSHHDYLWHESNLYKGGRELVYQGLKKGIFKKSQGAIVTDLSKYNLPDTVMIKKDGTSLYITFDINLTRQKKKKFPSDLYIWDIGNDQKLYMQQMFSVCEQLGIGKKKELFHLNYGYVYLKGRGKMSSREGTIVSADDLIDLLKTKAKGIRAGSAKGKLGLEYALSRHEEVARKEGLVGRDFDADRSKKEQEKVDEAVGLGALKYAMLKNSRATDIYFDIEESISLEGNSGPYLQYTYARCRSVLQRASSKFKAQDSFGMQSSKLNPEELSILRILYKLPEVVLEAGENFAPNLLCNFLYDLTTKFNTFYNQHRILNPKEGKATRELRLSLTQATAQVLKTGLELLGIKPLKKM